MRFLRAIGSLAALGALVAGVPVLLLAWGDPLVLFTVDWAATLTRPDDGTIVLGLLSAVGWIAWLVLVATTVTETIRVLSRGSFRPRIPGTAWLRPAVGGLVSAALAPLLSMGAVAHADAPPPIHHVATPHTPQPADDAAPDPADTSVQTGVTYVVQEGDELWSLAESHLGTGERWRDIVALNDSLSPTSVLTPGTAIILPLPEAHDAAVSTVQVQEGDTLWDLAEEHLGDAQRWPEIHHDNIDVISDPHHIEPGWELSLPDHQPAPATEATQSAPAPERPPKAPPPPDNSPGHPAPSGDENLPSTVGEETPPEQHDTEPGASSSDDGDSVSEEPHEDRDHLAPILGPIGGVLAAGLFVGIAARRRLQLLHRSIGSRLQPFAPDLQRFVSALGRAGAGGEQPVDSFTPTSVMIGWDGDQPLHLDLEAAGLTVVGGEPELTSGFTAAAITGLMCCPWTTSTNVTTVQPDQSWEAALDDPRLRTQPDLDAALKGLQQLVARRRIALRDASLTEVRKNPDLRDAFAPHIMVFCEPLEAAHLQRIRDSLALGDVGVSVIAATRTPAAAGAHTLVLLTNEDHASLNGEAFVPQLLTQPARRAIVDLFAAALDPTTEPAPWWRDESLPHNITVLPRRGSQQDQEEHMPPWNDSPDHPTLLLLGEVDLQGYRGRRPNRAVTQCLEYCAWLLENPESSPTTMGRDLMVADATRRSNMSRLRTWLGNGPTGEPYLPDAYSGHITLDSEVTSDWEHFQLLLSGGVNHAGDATLRAALSLVRGEPLHMVSFQWPWAEQLRNDMISMITDAAALLADRCLELADVEGAQWALERGIAAAGQDETLASRHIMTLSLLGDRSGVDRAVRALTRTARAEGRDLLPETARRIQLALHTVLTQQNRTS